MHVAASRSLVLRRASIRPNRRSTRMQYNTQAGLALTREERHCCLLQGCTLRLAVVLDLGPMGHPAPRQALYRLLC